MNVHNDSARDAPVAPALYTLARSSNLKDSMNNEQLPDSHTQHDDHSPHLDEVGAPKPMTGSDSMSAWEKRYASTQRLWSEDVNELLPEFAAPLAPGRALDIGCGEGTDLLYLLERGWQVVGVDFSATAIARFLDGAHRIGAADRATGLVGDARALHIEGLFDLVTIFFVHGNKDGSGVDLGALISEQASRLKPGGIILVNVHTVNPPWHRNGGRTYTATQILDSLRSTGMLTQDWTIQVAEERWEDVPASKDHEAGKRSNAVVVLRSPDM